MQLSSVARQREHQSLPGLCQVAWQVTAYTTQTLLPDSDTEDAEQ